MWRKTIKHADTKRSFNFPISFFFFRTTHILHLMRFHGEFFPPCSFASDYSYISDKILIHLFVSVANYRIAFPRDTGRRNQRSCYRQHLIAAESTVRLCNTRVYLRSFIIRVHDNRCYEARRYHEGRIIFRSFHEKPYGSSIKLYFVIKQSFNYFYRLPFIYYHLLFRKLLFASLQD